MTASSISVVFLLASIQALGQNTSFDVPKEWDKTFVISVSHTGSMSGGSSHLRLTYDSGVFVTESGHDRPKEKRFAMSQQDRSTILKKLSELRVEKIKTEISISAQNDGWSHMLCLGAQCIEGGSASRMNEKSKEIFVTASGYLERFAADQEMNRHH